MVADCLKPYYVRAGADIVTYGAKGDYFYVIAHGTCKVLDQVRA